ncbi:hypothetical protein PHIM7_328 [Sinorhizobium phage phiM7]|uniref:Uncharacterized protein n=3 Tax=Emdodecavirus TaxID=1980937 RepID=S5MBR1_9CAUD|nr:hypothetical protein AB690_gp186 [Sinorhizobium phage phiM12]YP_009212573.1 hypothetical protein AVT40_gp200 [Sinorhizobium phage phiN3]YP_009601453.1 hypothetical protein FDH46_gp150 [Sinorhizobium phage phiM7]AKF13233.1 hypothetical protein PHIM19_328 [Sinorhizobium phage phiM19]AGR48053.1 hypothetical protein SmphiM12_421 [Sinorhizobium phage phiM12]AKF12873.1 hypothetical protein PHIM7_328 [Sinorhizobium phage phiM7]AKF13596.1 hypothetical protein PHIN3_333 [Sinorhizobium phage phiN3]
MKKLISAIIDPFKNERLIGNERWVATPEPPTPVVTSRKNIDVSGFMYRHDGMWYFGKQGEKACLYSFLAFTLVSVVIMVTTTF